MEEIYASTIKTSLAREKEDLQKNLNMYGTDWFRMVDEKNVSLFKKMYNDAKKDRDKI